MKKCLLLLLLCCLMVGVVGSAGAMVSYDKAEYSFLVDRCSEADKQYATLIQAGVGYSDSDYSGFARFIPEVSGKYIISYACSFSAHVLEIEDVGRVSHGSSESFDLEANETYYLSCSGYSKFAICYPAQNLHPQNEEFIATSLANCTSPAVEEAFCQYCGMVIATREIAPALGHTPGEWVVEKPASCTGEGLYAQRCTVCNEVLNSTVLEKLAHTPGNEVEIRAATCIAPGQRGVYCIECSELLSTTEQPKTDHTQGAWVDLKPATCLDDGLRVQRCTVCNVNLSTETVSALGHAAVTTETASTCLIAGGKTTACSVCGITLSSEAFPQADHIPGSWTDLKAATCTAEGARVQRCTVCNATLNTETVPAFGHSPMEWVTAEENGCLIAGKRVQKCSLCGVTLAEESLPALPHQWSAWVTDIEATKEREGRNSRYCTSCGETETVATPKVEKFLGIF